MEFCFEFDVLVVKDDGCSVRFVRKVSKQKWLVIAIFVRRTQWREKALVLTRNYVDLV